MPEDPAAEKTFRELAAKGNQVIFVTSFGYMEAMLKVVKDYPNVKFHPDDAALRRMDYFVKGVLGPMN